MDYPPASLFTLSSPFFSAPGTVHIIEHQPEIRIKYSRLYKDILFSSSLLNNRRNSATSIDEILSMRLRIDSMHVASTLCTSHRLCARRTDSVHVASVSSRAVTSSTEFTRCSGFLWHRTWCHYFLLAVRERPIRGTPFQRPGVCRSLEKLYLLR
jgi:hypothetical protein